MKIVGSTVLVTGANRGIGRHFAQQLVARGASKVYATARDPQGVDVPGVHPLALDITDPTSVATTAGVASDVDLLINNAGVATYTNLVTGDLGEIHRELDTHFFGTLSMVRAFAPVLAGNGGGAVVNMLSALSWFSVEGATAYCAAKSAEWGLTNGIRLELAGQGTLVVGVHVGLVDTAMTAGVNLEKNDPADVVRAALDGLEAGRRELVLDAYTERVKAALSGDPIELYPDTAGGAVPAVTQL